MTVSEQVMRMCTCNQQDGAKTCPIHRTDLGKPERAEPSRGAPDAKHTHGPWWATPDPDCIRIWARLENGECDEIASVHAHLYSSAENARLIAQAPTLLAENEKLRSGHVVLLEALKHALPILIGAIAFVDCKAVVAEVRAAIKQAERA